MPSNKAILRDIHDLKLNPNQAHSSIRASGRLRKPEKLSVDSTMLIESDVLLEENILVVESEVVQSEPAEPEVVQSPIDVNLDTKELDSVVEDTTVVQEELQVVAAQPQKKTIEKVNKKFSKLTEKS